MRSERLFQASKPRRRQARWFIAGLAIVAACGGCGRRRDAANVILIVVDAMRADRLTHAGYARNTSPFLAKLAADSVLFENTISQSSWTKTSVASLLTSLYPEAHGVRRAKDVLPRSVQTLPEILKSCGYETYALHGNPWLEERFGFNQGFDRFLFTHWYKETFDAQRANGRVLRWLDERGTDQPFFIYLHYMDVHSPWQPPAEFDRFGPEAGDKYDGSILYLDGQLNSLYAELETRGLTTNTWIVVTSDHGEEFGEHGNYKVGHGLTLYGEVLRVPLIFHHPEVSSGKRVRRQVRLIDVAPTILDLLEMPIPKEMDGVSLRADVVEGDDPSEHDLEAFSQVGLNNAAPDRDLLALTTPRQKYILDFETGSEELYHLTVDPGETHDLAGDNPAMVREFRERAWRFRTAQTAKRTGIAPEEEIDEDLREQLRALGYLK